MRGIPPPQGVEEEQGYTPMSGHPLAVVPAQPRPTPLRSLLSCRPPAKRRRAGRPSAGARLAIS